jgi:hypothetical protein
LARTGRCKEGGSSSKSLLNWEPFWVATWSLVPVSLLVSFIISLLYILPRI